MAHAQAGCECRGVTVVAVAGLAGSATAAASDRWALNGTFTATSNGEWATNNDVFHDEQSVPQHLDHLDAVRLPDRVHGHRHQRQGLDGTDLPDRRRVVRQALHSGLDALLRRQVWPAGCRCAGSTA